MTTHRRQPPWQKVRLGEIAKVISGYAFKSSEFVHDGIPVIKIKNVRVGRTDLSDIECVDPRFESLDKRYHVTNGDVLISLTGSHLTQPTSVVGRVALHRGVRCLLNQRAGKIIVKNDQCDSRFVFYALSTHESMRSIALMASGAASQANVSPTQVESVELCIPSRQTQRKIASILSAYDDLIENNTRRITILDEMAQAIYREWFVEFRFPGHEKVALVDSPLGKIPKEWEHLPLSHVADVNALSIKKGTEPEEANYVDIASVSTGMIDEIRLLPFSEAPGRARRILRHGDIIWSTVRPNRKSYSLILNPLENMISSTGFAVISGTKAPFTYLYHALTTNDFVGYLVNHATGSAYPAVNSGDFEKAEVLVPTDRLLTAFHETTSDMFLLKHSLQEKNRRLRSTRDLLIPKLISGQFDVEDLDIDTGEPLAGGEHMAKSEAVA